MIRIFFLRSLAKFLNIFIIDWNFSPVCGKLFQRLRQMIVKSVVDLHESIVAEHYDSCSALGQVFIGADPFNGFGSHIRLGEVETSEEKFEAASAHGALEKEWSISICKENWKILEKIKLICHFYSWKFQKLSLILFFKKFKIFYLSFLKIILMWFIEALRTQPRTTLTSWTISFDLAEQFLVVGAAELRRRRFDAVNAVAAQSLPL